MEVLVLVDRIDDMVLDAPRVPFSSHVRVARDKLLAEVHALKDAARHEVPHAESTQTWAMIEQLEALVLAAPPVPLSRSVRFDLEAVYDLLDGIRAALPEDLRQGRTVPRHTSDLTEAELAAVRALLGDVFGAELTDDDVEHALGGMHALVWEAGELIAHAAVVQRRLLHGGRALRTGYVEGVAVREQHRRRGHGEAAMRALEPVIRSAYDLGALSATEAAMPLYRGLGWQPWAGPTFVLTPDGRRRTPDDDGSVLVLPAAATLDLAGELTCDWRDGDPW